MFNRLRFTPARLGAIEQRELIGFYLSSKQAPASQPSASTQLSGGGRTVTMPGMTTKVGAGGTAIARVTKP
jgi:hypothetical protein